MPRVTLYGKPGCHLCDDARAVLGDVASRRPFELEEVDITLDPAFDFFVDPERLVELLDRAVSASGRPPGGR